MKKKITQQEFDSLVETHMRVKLAEEEKLPKEWLMLKEKIPHFGSMEYLFENPDIFSISETKDKLLDIYEFTISSIQEFQI